MNNWYRILLLLPTLTFARVWYVHPDSALNSIQAGLDSCTDNDTVVVGPGTYYENIIWPDTKGIDLISEYGADTTIIDGDDSGCVVVFNYQNIDTTTLIQGLTIQNGYGTYGGGIFCDSLTSPMIVQNTVKACTSSWNGGGILLRKASAYIIENIITGNYAGNWGGGVCVIGYSSLVSRSNTIVGNMAHFEGGGVYLAMANADMREDTIRLNHSDVPGDGICCYHSLSPITINDCVISENMGEGIYGDFCSQLIIHDCSITDNTTYGVRNHYSSDTIDATRNWWGDSTGPYHPNLNPNGLGNPVSDYVDFIPWRSSPGVVEQRMILPGDKDYLMSATIFSGPILVPEGNPFRIFDITGHQIHILNPVPGIYFIEVDGEIQQKVIKIK